MLIYDQWIISKGDLILVTGHSCKNNVIKGHSQLLFHSFHGLLTFEWELPRKREEQMTYFTCQIKKKKKAHNHQFVTFYIWIVYHLHFHLRKKQ